MGQGTDSCGGYEVDYDALSEAPDGVWIQANGQGIHVTKMALSHLQKARSLAERHAECATFSDDSDRWQRWVETFDDEIAHRREQERKVHTKAMQTASGSATAHHAITAIQALAQAAGLSVTVQAGHVHITAGATTQVPTSPRIQAAQRGAKTAMVCHCGQRYDARTADIKRGWALSCSKRCAAIRRDFGRPAAKKAT